MARIVKGDVVVIPFPFSDLSLSKRRPAVVLAELEGNDRILCQITSRRVLDRYAVTLDDSDFESGNLRVRSNVRLNRLFTADAKIVLYTVGWLKPAKMQVIIERVVQILTK